MRTPPPTASALEALRARASRAGIILDFDGTLSEIVERPELARPVSGAREALSAVVPRYAVVAVITGRRAEEVAGLISVDGVRYQGLYGMEDVSADIATAVRPLVEAVAAGEPGAWLEDKGATLAVHYRQAADPDRARVRLLGALESVAASAGLELAEGKMVIEVFLRERPMKGDAVERIAGELGLQGVLFAGDDLGDLAGFSALDRLHERGLVTVKVAVRGPETPEPVLRAGDLVVDGPAGTVDVLRSLAEPG